jgi:hypothetical protein
MQRRSSAAVRHARRHDSLPLAHLQTETSRNPVKAAAAVLDVVCNPDRCCGACFEVMYTTRLKTHSPDSSVLERVGGSEHLA